MEKKLYEAENLEENIREDVGYSLQALESMLLMEQNKNTSLKNDLKLLKSRLNIINSFDDSEL